MTPMNEIRHVESEITDVENLADKVNEIIDLLNILMPMIASLKEKGEEKK